MDGSWLEKRFRGQEVLGGGVRNWNMLWDWGVQAGLCVNSVNIQEASKAVPS